MLQAMRRAVSAVEYSATRGRAACAAHATEGKAMGISFKDEVGADVVALMRELYGEPAASDGKTFLYDKGLERVSRTAMNAIANRAKQPASLEMYGADDVVTMSDGTQYRVTPNGWQKVVKGEQ